MYTVYNTQKFFLSTYYFGDQGSDHLILQGGGWFFLKKNQDLKFVKKNNFNFIYLMWITLGYKFH